MAKTYSVALYTLSVLEKKRSKKNGEEPKHLRLSDKISGSLNFYDFVEKYLGQAQKQIFEDKKNETHLRIHNFKKHNSTHFYVDGVIESGESGSAQKLYHTQNKTERDKLKEEANLEPFYFCFRETNDPEYLALCLQRIGNQGIKTQVIKSLQDVFRKMFPDHILSIEDHLPEYYRKRFFENNVVMRLEYTYSASLSDVASSLEAEGERDMKKNEAIVRLSVQPNRGFLHKFRNSLHKPVREVLSEMKPKALALGHDKLIDTSVTLSDKDGNTRTFRTSQNRDILPYIDVTDHVKRGQDGHPIFKDMQDVVTVVLENANLIDNNG
ncbi:MAG: hypothetical protein RLY66_185 [Candidatus Parcubacteria bacterium]|jgi:hypothetical protein